MLRGMSEVVKLLLFVFIIGLGTLLFQNCSPAFLDSGNPYEGLHFVGNGDALISPDSPTSDLQIAFVDQVLNAVDTNNRVRTLRFGRDISGREIVEIIYLDSVGLKVKTVPKGTANPIPLNFASENQIFISLQMTHNALGEINFAEVTIQNNGGSTSTERLSP